MTKDINGNEEPGAKEDDSSDVSWNAKSKGHAVERNPKMPTSDKL